MTSQVRVGTLLMSDGCHIDGSHETVISFDLRVIHFAVDKGGFDLNVEDSKIVYDADHGQLAIGDLPTLTEIADEAVERLNAVTEDGFTWHVDEQSLFLSDVFDLPDSDQRPAKAVNPRAPQEVIGTLDEIKSAIEALDLDRAKRALDAYEASRRRS